MPRIHVIGGGSIGLRHARNLEAAGARVTVWDPAPSPDLERSGLAGDEPWPTADGYVVASPTVHHAEHLARALDVGGRVFVEKPIAVAPAEVADLVAAHGDRMMVGYNLRLHEPLVALADTLRSGRVGEVHGARLWFGQYLPDWRPTVDYRRTYSARRDLGGGVLLDAIHEIDLAVWMLGPDLDVHSALVTRVGDLELDVEDTVRALLVTGTGAPVDLSLDYLSRTYRRGVELVGSEATARYDWARGLLDIEDASGRSERRFDTPVGRSYELEAAAFLRFVADGDAPPVDGRAGLRSLELAHEIRSIGA